MQPNRIRLTIDSNLADVFLIGLLVNNACRYAGLGESDAYQMELCVVEAVNNSIRHAYREQPGHEVAVALAIHPDRLEFKIFDRGTPIPEDKLAVLRAGGSKLDYDPARFAELPEGGMGFHILLEVMDEIRYESSGGENCLRLVKRTPAAAGAG